MSDMPFDLDRWRLAELGHQAGVLQEPQFALLAHVDDHGVVRLPPQQEGHDAVVTGRGVLLDALVAIDPHAPIIPRGCDS